VSAPNIGAWADAFSFVADMRREENRPKLLTGVFTGYMTALLLGGLALAAQHFGLLPDGPWFYSVLGLKLLTNTLAWIGLRTRLLGITFSGANVIADIFVMTAAIYFTGGQLSPLVPIYFVETTVMALLSNVSLTVITVLLSFCFYTTMALLVHAGVLVAHPPPLNASAAITLPYLLCDLAFVAGVLFGPGTYIALIVQRLRQKEAALEEHARELAQASKLKSQFMPTSPTSCALRSTEYSASRRCSAKRSTGRSAAISARPSTAFARARTTCSSSSTRCCYWHAPRSPSSSCTSTTPPSARWSTASRPRVAGCAASARSR